MVWIGGAQLVLDRGERADWFDATWVWIMSGTAAVALVAFILWELRHSAPIVDFRLLKNPTAMAFLDSFWVIGIASLACVPLVVLMRKFTGTPVVGH